MFRKYVLRLVWRVQIKPDGSAVVQDRLELTEAEAEEESFQAAIAHLQSLADCLEVGRCFPYFRPCFSGFVI